MKIFLHLFNGQRWLGWLVVSLTVALLGVGNGCGSRNQAPIESSVLDETIKPTDQNAGPVDPTESPGAINETEVTVVDPAPPLVPMDLTTQDLGGRRPSFFEEYHGLEYQGFVIPHKGKANRFLAPFGRKTESLGKVIDLSGFFSRSDFVEGKVSWFGGSKDTGVTSKETGAITGETLRRLNPNSFYAAMRFDYGASVDQGRKFWKQARLLVVNPKNGRAVVVRPVDWGPNPRTDRIVDVSPGTLEVLGNVQTDQSLWISFAKPDARLGLVRSRQDSLDVRAGEPEQVED